MCYEGNILEFHSNQLVVRSLVHNMLFETFTFVLHMISRMFRFAIEITEGEIQAMFTAVRHSRPDQRYCIAEMARDYLSQQHVSVQDLIICWHGHGEDNSHACVRVVFRSNVDKLSKKKI